MAIARNIDESKKQKPGRTFIRTLIASAVGRTKDFTRKWSPFFWLLVGTGFATFVLELTRHSSPWWYAFVLVIAVSTVALEIISLYHAAPD